MSLVEALFYRFERVNIELQYIILNCCSALTTGYLANMVQ